MAITFLILLGILAALVVATIVGAIVWAIGSFFGWILAMTGHDDLFKDRRSL